MCIAMHPEALVVVAAAKRMVMAMVQATQVSVLGMQVKETARVVSSSPPASQTAPTPSMKPATGILRDVGPLDSPSTSSQACGPWPTSARFTVLACAASAVPQACE